MTAEKIPAISVIIPMYNAENFIGECLNSLLNQTLKDFEVIVVDDCSGDNSVAVVEKMFPAFSSGGVTLSTLKSNKNSGTPGILRNFALTLAKGKYIYFLDSDDFLDATALEELYNVAEEFRADVVHSEKCFVREEVDGEWQEILFSTQVGEFVEQPTLETPDVAKRVTDFVENKYLWCCCNKLFRREFLTENAINFPPTTISEDMIFAFMCVVCAKNYVRVPHVNYHYRIHGAALSQTATTTDDISLNLFEGVYFLDNFMQRQNFFVQNPNCQYAVLDFFNQMFFDIISENLLVAEKLEPAQVYAHYCDEIFTLDPSKNISLTAYLFVSTNIYRLFVKRQAAEIAQLKKSLNILD